MPRRAKPGYAPKMSSAPGRPPHCRPLAPNGRLAGNPTVQIGARGRGLLGTFTAPIGFRQGSIRESGGSSVAAMGGGIPQHSPPGGLCWLLQKPNGKPTAPLGAMKVPQGDQKRLRRIHAALRGATRIQRQHMVPTPSNA